ncbi:MAG TPA: hypothetical protein PLZ31_03230 [Myxococcota bacterium]|nr:hypothetical protein [Myxococcota bacterium]HNZ04093.1 hypothetical protein [Myxococcota bacterium]HOD07337.1 hypothetical protein [Myxococcota bacterium]HPB50232.1 hypothetical protein [Myxococcota bacterium]
MGPIAPGMGDSIDDATITIKNGIAGMNVGCWGNSCELFCVGLHEDHDFVVWGQFQCKPLSQPQGADTHDRSILMKGFCKLSTDPTPTEMFVNNLGCEMY